MIANCCERTFVLIAFIIPGTILTAGLIPIIIARQL